MTEQKARKIIGKITLDRVDWEELEAINIAVKALEKQIPKEPLDFGNEAYLCPYCKRNNFYKGEYLDKQNYCDYCGQAIKWE